MLAVGRRDNERGGIGEQKDCFGKFGQARLGFEEAAGCTISIRESQQTNKEFQCVHAQQTHY